MDQDRGQAPLPEGEQEGRRTGPHQGRPGAQRGAPGDGAGGVPGSHGGQGHGQDHEQVDERAPVQARERAEGEGRRQEGEEWVERPGVPVAGAAPGAPGRLPQLPPGEVEQGQRPARHGAGDQDPGGADQADGRGDRDRRRQHPAAPAGQDRQLSQLELGGGGGAGGPFALLAGAIAPARADLGGGHVQLGHDGAGHGGQLVETAPLGPQAPIGPGHGPGRGELVARQARGLGQQPPRGADEPQNEDPGQQERQGPGGEGRPGPQLGRPARPEGALGVGLGLADDGLAPLPVPVGRARRGGAEAGPQAEVGGAPVADAGAGHDDDAVTGQAQGAGDCQAVAEGADVVAQGVQGGPGGAADEGPGGAHGEDVAAGVVLALVDLALDDVVGAARGGGDAQADLEELLGTLPVDLLGPGHGNGAGVGHDRPQLGQAGGLGSGVVVEEPYPRAGGGAVGPAVRLGEGLGPGDGRARAPRRGPGPLLVGALAAVPHRAADGAGPAGAAALAGGDQLGVAAQPLPHGGEEGGGLGGAHDPHIGDVVEPGVGDGVLDGGAVAQAVGARGGVDEENDLRRPGLGRDGPQRPVQIRGDPAGDDDREGLQSEC